MIETIARLRERRVEVEVLAPSYRGLGNQLLDGTVVHRFRYAPRRLETLTHDQTAPDRLREKPFYSLLLPGYVFAGSMAAARLARSGRFDIIHAFWPLPHGLFGISARRVSGVPLVSTFFGVELTWVRNQLPFLTPLLTGIIRRSDAVTVISSHTESEVRRLVPGAATVNIPFGAAIGGAPSTATEPETSLPDESFRLLFVGRLVERKGLAILLEAMVGLSERRAVQLTVVGDGPMRGQLQALSAELGLGSRVRFAGFVSSAELSRLYQASDAFVLPAVRDSKGDVEGLGVVLIEALLQGVPVVASRSGGIPDIVVDGETGLLVPPSDVASLQTALTRLMDDPKLASRLADAGRQYVTKRFSWERIIDDLEALYRQVATPSSAAAAREQA